MKNYPVTCQPILRPESISARDLQLMQMNPYASPVTEPPVRTQTLEAVSSVAIAVCVVCCGIHAALTYPGWKTQCEYWIAMNAIVAETAGLFCFWLEFRDA